MDTITVDLLKRRIDLLETEERHLRESHNEMIRKYREQSDQVRQTADVNTARLNQISGSILALKSLLNGAENQGNNTT